MMMNKILLLLLSFVSLNGTINAQDSIPPATITYYDYYDRKKGNIKTIETYAGKVLNGVQAKYYPNGSIIYRIHYDMGKIKEDTIYMKHPNGNILMQIPLKNGLAHGIVKVLYRKGKIENEIPYNMGLKSGVAKYYSEKGKLLKEAEFLNGRRNGSSITYLKKGKMIEYTRNDTLINRREMYDKKQRLTHIELIDELGTNYVKAFYIKEGKEVECPVIIWNGYSLYSKDLDISLPKEILAAQPK